MSQRTNKGYYNAGNHKRMFSMEGFVAYVNRKEPGLSPEILKVRYHFYTSSWRKFHKTKKTHE